MKHVIRYLLDGDGTIPVFVQDGGYFVVNNEMVGVSVDDSQRHVPGSVHKLTRAELAARIEATQLDIDRNPITAQAASDMADAFLAQRGMAAYA